MSQKVLTVKEMGRMGGLARARKLSKKRIRDIARKAGKQSRKNLSKRRSRQIALKAVRESNRVQGKGSNGKHDCIKSACGRVLSKLH